MKFALVFFALFSEYSCANILFFSCVPSVSHQNVFRPIWKELSLRGHKVFAVATDPIGDAKLTNLTEIDVSTAYRIFKKDDFSNLRREGDGSLSVMRKFAHIISTALDIEIRTEGFQDLLKKPADFFDLIIVEIHHPIVYAIQHKFKAPMIAISSLGVNIFYHNLYGNSIHPALYPDLFSEISVVAAKMGLIEKIDSVIFTTLRWLIYKYEIVPMVDYKARSYFGEDMPYIEELMKNVSVVLLNVNPIFSERRPNVPNVIEFFNVHVAATKNLPPDLEQILNKEGNGIIYFSLGTNVRINNIQGDVKKEILSALSELPYTVLCKWDTQDHIEKPKNVIFRSWFPQQDLLVSNVGLSCATLIEYFPLLLEWWFDAFITEMMRALVLFSFCVFSIAECAKILGWFATPSISHQIIFQPIWRELSLRGHEVTVITPNPLNDPLLINLTEIDVKFTYKVWEKFPLTNMRSDQVDIIKLELYFSRCLIEAVKMTITNDEVKEIINKPANYFDLLFIETNHPLLYGLQHKFKAPLVSISSLGTFNYLESLFGDSIHPSLYGDCISSFYGKFTMWEKINSFYALVGSYLVNKFIIHPEADELARFCFGNDMPYITDMVKASSILFLNKNPVFSDRRPIAPNVIYFTSNPSIQRETINEDLQKILDDAKSGFVYFSLGTNVRFEHVDLDIKKEILLALGKVPYKVLCKWDPSDNTEKPANVIFRSWLPQQAVLAHPNIKVFVTQGGLQSSEEAISNGVPVVVIPFLGDQPLNAKIMQSHGMAEVIFPNAVTKDSLVDKIVQVASNESYRAKARELRDIFLDQPQSGLDKVVWWCEYVIRHKGAKHLRSPSADISLYEYFLLDVFAVLLAAIFVFYLLIKFTIRGLLKIIRKNVSTKKKTR